MIDEKYIDLVTGYLQDSLTADEKSELEKYIEEGKIDILELKELEALYQKTGQIPVPKPSEAMHSRFYSMLEKEKQRQQAAPQNKLADFFKSMQEKIQWQVAAGVAAVFVIGLFIGMMASPFNSQHRQVNRLGRQLTQMKQVVALNLLDNPSAIKRLKAVNISMSIPSGDQRVVDALLKTLNHDPSINVRLAAVQSLVRHAGNPAARRGLVQSIDKQTSPLVRVALADAMLALQDTHSVQEFKKLLKRDDLNRSVRQKIQHTVHVLNKKV